MDKDRVRLSMVRCAKEYKKYCTCLISGGSRDSKKAFKARTEYVDVEAVIVGNTCTASPT